VRNRFHLLLDFESGKQCTRFFARGERAFRGVAQFFPKDTTPSIGRGEYVCVLRICTHFGAFSSEEMIKAVCRECNDDVSTIMLTLAMRKQRYQGLLGKPKSV